MRLRTSITSLVLLITALLASPVHSTSKAKVPAVPQALPAKADASLRVLAFGDSLTAGYRLPQKEAWPAELEALLNNEFNKRSNDGRRVQVTNAGVSGDTTGQGLRRIDWALKKGPYSLVLVGLGANDGMRNLPLKDLKSNLVAIVERFKKTNAKVLLLGMKLPTNQDAKYRQAFEAIYTEVAKSQAVPLVPFLLEGIATDEILNLDDQIHPNRHGHKKIAQNLVGRVIELLPPRVPVPAKAAETPRPSGSRSATSVKK